MKKNKEKEKEAVAARSLLRFHCSLRAAASDATQSDPLVPPMVLNLYPRRRRRRRQVRSDPSDPHSYAMLLLLSGATH